MRDPIKLFYVGEFFHLLSMFLIIMALVLTQAVSAFYHGLLFTALGGLVLGSVLLCLGIHYRAQEK